MKKALCHKGFAIRTKSEMHQISAHRHNYALLVCIPGIFGAWHYNWRIIYKLIQLDLSTLMLVQSIKNKHASSERKPA